MPMPARTQPAVLQGGQAVAMDPHSVRLFNYVGDFTNRTSNSGVWFHNRQADLPTAVDIFQCAFNALPDGRFAMVIVHAATA